MIKFYDSYPLWREKHIGPSSFDCLRYIPIVSEVYGTVRTIPGPVQQNILLVTAIFSSPHGIID